MGYEKVPPSVISGALWRKKASTGNEYLAGLIRLDSGEECNVIFFGNFDKGGNLKAPDYKYEHPSRKRTPRVARPTVTNNMEL